MSGPREGAAWKWAERRTYTAVRADEVKRGDVLANGPSVTVSRRATKKDMHSKLPVFNGEEVPLSESWFIRCGSSYSVFCAAAAPKIVGRLERA